MTDTTRTAIPHNRIAELLPPAQPAAPSATTQPAHGPDLIRVRLLLRNSEPIPTDQLIEDARQGRGIDRARFVETYGPSPGDLAAIEAFARDFDLTFDRDHRPAFCTVELSGTSEHVGQAFTGTIEAREIAGQSFVVAEGQLTVPAALAGLVRWLWIDGAPGVGAVHGGYPSKSAQLSALAAAANRQTTRATSEPGPIEPAFEATAPIKWLEGSLQPVTHFPPQFADFYDFPRAYQGRGQCIGVLSLLGGFKPSDLETYYRAVGCPEVMKRLVLVGDNELATGADSWANLETTMDIEIASSCAPRAQTVVYFSGARTGQEVNMWHYYKLYSMALFDTENQPSVLTLSGGLPENLPGIWTQAEAEVLNGLLAVGACLAVTLCLPTGDSGSIYPVGSGMFSAPSLAYFPASSPWSLAVGGTTLEVEAGRVRGERVWNRLGPRMNLIYGPGADTTIPFNLGSTGGGPSMYFERPEWQEGFDVPPYQIIDFTDWQFSNSRAFLGRGIPDLAACSDFLTGYAVHLDGNWCSGGGTSASTPFFAAMVIRMNEALGQPLGYVTPILYKLSSSAFNKLEGNNAGYVAKPGAPWNACVGLGSPRGEQLIKSLRAYLAA